MKANVLNDNFENMSLNDILFELSNNTKTNNMLSDNCFVYESANLLNNVISNLTPSKKRFALLILELYKRTKTNKEKSKIIQSSDDIFNMCKDMAFLDREEIRVIAINGKGSVIECKTMFKGGYTSCISDNRIIFKWLLDVKAVSFILVHNHPSGANLPSSQDNCLTKSLLNFGSFVGITLLDHVIISSEYCYYSYSDNGKLTL